MKTKLKPLLITVLVATGILTITFFLTPVVAKVLFSIEQTQSYDNFFAIHDKNPDGCSEHTTIYLRNDTGENRTRIEICRRENKQFHNLVIHNPRANLPKECLYPDSNFYRRLYNTKNHINP